VDAIVGERFQSVRAVGGEQNQLWEKQHVSAKRFYVDRIGSGDSHTWAVGGDGATEIYQLDQ
jgi:hypothetical protein